MHRDGIDMKIISVILYSAMVLASSASADAELPAENVFSEIESRYGIKVRYVTGGDFFPMEWAEPPISAGAKEIGTSSLGRFPRLLDRALSRYPGEFINRHLKAVYLTGELYFYGAPYGATSSSDGIYLNDRGEGAGYSDDYLVGSIHHELAHILLRKYAFPAKKWNSLNPAGFRYRGGDNGGLQAIKRGGSSLTGSVSLYKRGFLSEYSLSSREEDFCMYSEAVFTGPGEFSGLMKKYPAIKRKFNQWLEFYRAIDGSITNEYIFGAKP